MNDETIEIAGLLVNVVPHAECEEADFVVCGAVSHFPDDVHTTCCGCGTPIIHRPYVPTRPPKICLGCLVAMESPKH